MVPASVIGVLVFLLMVAPGTCYELLRSRSRLPIEESSFVHISRILLSGVMLTTLTLLLLTAVNATSPNTVLDLPQLLTNGTPYVAGHMWLTVKTFALQLFVSALLAAVVDDLRASTRTVRIHRGTALLGLAEIERPESTQPYFCVRLKSGRQVFGYYYGATTDLDPTKRELVLQPPIKIVEADQEDAKTVPPHWQRMVISGGEVEQATIAYVETYVVPPLGFVKETVDGVRANVLRAKFCIPAILILLGLALIP